MGVPQKTTLSPGTRIDRFGLRDGSFVAPQGVPFPQRSLPPGYSNRPYEVYEVIKPLEVLKGRTAPWFGQPGGGIQYQLGDDIQQLIDDKIIRVIVRDKRIKG